MHAYCRRHRRKALKTFTGLSANTAHKFVNRKKRKEAMFDTIEQARSKVFSIAQNCNRLLRARVNSPIHLAGDNTRAAIFFIADIFDLTVLNQKSSALLTHRSYRTAGLRALCRAWHINQKTFSSRQPNVNRIAHRNKRCLEPKTVRCTTPIFSNMFSQNDFYKGFAIGMRLLNKWREPHDK